VSILLNVRNGLRSMSRKLVIEAIVSSLSTAIVLTTFSFATRPVSRALHGEGRQPGTESSPVDDATNAAVKEFMERVALSHVVSLKPPASATEAAVFDPSRPTTPASIPARSRAAVAHDIKAPRVRSAHVAASILPPPRPTVATVDDAIEGAPEEMRQLLPLREAVHFATDSWRAVPDIGAFFAKNVDFAGDAAISLAKKL
jgi:hypothetical protein